MMNPGFAYAGGAPHEEHDWWTRWRRVGAMATARRHGGHSWSHGGGARFGGWAAGSFPGLFFGRGPKVGRGDVRTAILVLLAEESMHGYQVIQELTERSGGVWRPSPGSVYPTLQQLQDEGLVRGEDSDGRRVFHLTDAGRAEVAKRDAEERQPWDLTGDAGPLIELRESAFGVAAALVQVAQTGNERQVAKAKEILTETRKSLYGLLADGGEGDAG